MFPTKFATSASSALTDMLKYLLMFSNKTPEDDLKK